ncbi:hypothetical protein V8G54_013529 [Vigna mungo]|uniref:Wall-associated receptor kinase C-terminal domain-containing protein n=1 Tax=Vigna mungo TaxID=3915 RepID=A0AAQ3S4D3_VIGMU
MKGNDQSLFPNSFNKKEMERPSHILGILKCLSFGREESKRKEGGCVHSWCIYGDEKNSASSIYIALIYARRSVRMDEKHNHVHTTPLAFALTVSWLLCIALPQSHSQTPPPLCAEQSYGCSANVSAIFDPFWEQNPPSQCNGGDASSQLICDTRYESQNFTVKDVDNSSRTLTVVPTHTVNDLCSPEFFDVFFKLVNKLLQYYVPVYNIILFSNCDNLPDFLIEHRNFTCWGGGYYFVDEYRQHETLRRYPEVENCPRPLPVPSAAPLYHYNHFDDGAEVLKEILRDGFGVYYGFPHDCRRCNQSNGSCSGDGGNDEYVVSCKYYCTHKHCSPHNSSGTYVFHSFFPFSSHLLMKFLCYIAMSSSSVYL